MGDAAAEGTPAETFKEARPAESNLVSVLEYLPQEMRAQLTRERLECLRTIGELQAKVKKLEAAALGRPQDYETRQSIAGALGEERGGHNTVEHICWLIRKLIAATNKRRTR
mgnify:FL=1|tara:strand:+ start:3791 stop:4126 length:336 start_codon:yes stop_codon:yes gene_type:complete